MSLIIIGSVKILHVRAVCTPARFPGLLRCYPKCFVLYLWERIWDRALPCLGTGQVSMRTTIVLDTYLLP